MKTGIIIPVRMTSNRLPGKPLKKIKGKEVAQYIYERLELTKIDQNNIIFATSTEKNDDEITEFCYKNSYKFFRGSKNNVALRLLNCANYYNFDAFIRINGDNIFTDKDVINDMINIYKNNNYDVVTNVAKRTFPYGISVEIIRTKFYDTIYKNLTDFSDKEHVTLYIYRNLDRYNVYSYQSNNMKYKDVKLALDTEKDFKNISKIIKSLKDDHRKYKIEDIVDLYYLII